MRWSIVTFLLLISALSVAQTPATGTIRGYVTDVETGETILFGLVWIPNTTNGVQTDVNGFYSMTKLAPDTYDICAAHPAYERDTIKNVIVKAGEFIQLNIKLKQAQVDTVRIHSDPPSRPDIIRKIAPVESPLPDKATQNKRMMIVGGTQLVLATGSLIALSQLWYKDYPHSSFHTFNDNREWLQMDKIGHMQTAYTTGQISASLWYWTGMKYKPATWIGGLTGFAYQSVIEIMDGYSVGWGFSPGDILANATGSALFISQQLTWHEQRIQPKFGFRRSGLAEYRPNILGSNYSEEILKDYNGQTYWLSVNVASFLRDETRFPKWLNVAFGYGANGMTGGHSNPQMFNAQGNEITLQRYRQYYLSLDIDLHKLPVKSPFLRWVFNFIGFIKIPAPGIEFSRNGVRPLLFAF